MRHWLLTLLFVVAALVGYALAPLGILAEPAPAAFTYGHTLVLIREDGRKEQPCTVVRQRGDFVACSAIKGSPTVWYNLRFVERVQETSGG